MFNYGVVYYVVKLTIPGVGLDQHYQVLVPVGTQLDLAGGIVRIVIHERIVTQMTMTRRVVVIRYIRRHIEVPTWTYRRRVMDCHYHIVQTLHIVL